MGRIGAVEKGVKSFGRRAATKAGASKRGAATGFKSGKVVAGKGATRTVRNSQAVGAKAKSGVGVAKKGTKAVNKNRVGAGAVVGGGAVGFGAGRRSKKSR